VFINVFYGGGEKEWGRKGEDKDEDEDQDEDQDEDEDKNEAASEMASMGLLVCCVVSSSWCIIL